MFFNDLRPGWWHVEMRKCSVGTTTFNFRRPWICQASRYHWHLLESGVCQSKTAIFLMPKLKPRSIDSSIYLRFSKRMDIEKDVTDNLEKIRVSDLTLELKKALYGLKEARRLWIELFSHAFEKFGIFAVPKRYVSVPRTLLEVLLWLVSIWTIYWWQRRTANPVDIFVDQSQHLSLKTLGKMHKFLERRITYTEDTGYDINQKQKWLAKKCWRTTEWNIHAVFVHKSVRKQMVLDVTI